MKLTFGYPTGVAYFRPPNPPRSEHKKHLHLIKYELGFDAVRLRLQWNAIHRRPDHFEWTEYDEIIDICESIGLAVTLETNLESAPYWLEREHPDALYISSNGRVIDLGGYESTQFGGYPGLCFHHPATHRNGELFLQAIAEHFANRSCVLLYDCWNEPHLEPAWISIPWANTGDQLYCYCENSKRAFRQWLQQKYHTVDELNSTWGRAYGEWLDVCPPNRSGTYADWLDWGRFWFDELSGEMQWRYSTIRSRDSGRPIVSHSGAVPPFLARAPALIHNWKLASVVDMWGTSYAPKAHNWRMSECAGTMEATRSAASGKTFWISEMSGGGTNFRGFWKSPPPQAMDYRVWNWLAICYGAKGTFYWCYLEESTGPEAGGYGLIRANGEITGRARSASETARIVRDCWRTIGDFNPQPQVGIIYDPDNSQQLFAMEATDELYMRSNVGYYRAVWDSDVYCRYLTYDTLDEIEDLKVVIIPMCLTLRQEVATALRSWVQKGGILIAEARTGLFDVRGYIQPVLPSHGLSEVFGVVEEEALCSDPGNRPPVNNAEGRHWAEPYTNGPELCTESGHQIRAHGYYVPLRTTTAEAIGSSNQHVLVTRNIYGNGTCFYFGTYLGLAMFQGDSGANEFFRDLLKQHVRPFVRGNQLRPRLILGQGESILAVFNDSLHDEIKDTLQLTGAFRHARDVYSGECIDINNCEFEIEIPPESVRVFRLT